jgi:hypothetical protein
MEEKQAGKCSLGYRSDRNWPKNGVTFDQRLRITIDADGAFTAVPILKGDLTSPDVAWWGLITKDLKINAQRTSKAECQGIKSEVITRLKGQIGQSSAGPTLELSGQEQACPKMGCVFDLSYRLARK